MTDDQNKTLLLLDDVIAQLEHLMRDSSAIGMDRARISMILANCKQVREGLRAARSGPSSSEGGGAGPATGGRSSGLDCAGAPRSWY